MADLSHLESQMALSASQIVQKSAERQKLTSTIEAQKSLILTLQQRVDMRDALKGTNSFSKSNYLDSIEALRSQQTTLVQEVGQIGEIDANLEVIRRDSRQTLRNFVGRQQPEAGRGGTASRQPDREARAGQCQDRESGDRQPDRRGGAIADPDQCRAGG